MKKTDLQHTILEHISTRYAPAEYPALLHELHEAESRHSFAGLRILDATPVFTNTMVKYMGLLAGGAELALGYGNGIPFDAGALERLKEWGVPCFENGTQGDYDIILDCAALNRSLTPSIGAVELTRSGAVPYEDASCPVYLADSGTVKQIETGLGTGDSFRRALEHLKLGPVAGKDFLLFGCGKVGLGIAISLLRNGASLAVADFEEMRNRVPGQAAFIPLEEKDKIEAAIGKAWCIVTATGVAGALEHYSRSILASKALLANMGVGDEFGGEIPPRRVLNRKQPLNFILDEPTQLRYIDATMALDNYGARILAENKGNFASGIILPGMHEQQPLLDAVVGAGLIADEVNDFLTMLKRR